MVKVRARNRAEKENLGTLKVRLFGSDRAISSCVSTGTPGVVGSTIGQLGIFVSTDRLTVNWSLFTHSGRFSSSGRVASCRVYCLCLNVPFLYQQRDSVHQKPHQTIRFSTYCQVIDIVIPSLGSRWLMINTLKLCHYIGSYGGWLKVVTVVVVFFNRMKMV